MQKLLQLRVKTTLSAELIALQGFQLGFDGVTLLSGSEETISANGFLSFGVGYGVKIGGIPVLVHVNDNDIRLSGAQGDLLLGSEQTKKIRFFAGVADIDGDNILVSKYGRWLLPCII